MTNQQLIEDCLRGNAKSQRQLFQRFAGKMMTVCRRYACDLNEAEDMLQEAFIKVFHNLGQYRFEGSLEGWIRRIVVHSALKVLQRKKIRYSEVDEETEMLVAHEADVVAALGAEELLAMIGELAEGYRIVFNLYVIEGYDHNEIGELLGISPATSRSQLLKARRVLQARILDQKKIAERYAS